MNNPDAYVNAPNAMEQEAKLPIMQVFWGKMDIGIPQQKYQICCKKQWVNRATHMEWLFELPTGKERQTAAQEETEESKELELKEIKFPAHFFWRAYCTNQQDGGKTPTTLVFELHDLGLQELEKQVPDLVKKVKDYHGKKLKAFPEVLFFVLDPSLSCELSTNGTVIFHSKCDSILHVFIETFAQHWADHNKVYDRDLHKNDRLTFDPMTSMPATELQTFVRTFDLRYIESQIVTRDQTRMVVRKFTQNEELTPKRIKRGTNSKWQVQANSEEIEEVEMDPSSDLADQNEEKSLELEVDVNPALKAKSHRRRRCGDDLFSALTSVFIGSDLPAKRLRHQPSTYKADEHNSKAKKQ